MVILVCMYISNIFRVRLFESGRISSQIRKWKDKVLAVQDLQCESWPKRLVLQSRLYLFTSGCGEEAGPVMQGVS